MFIVVMKWFLLHLCNAALTTGINQMVKLFDCRCSESESRIAAYEVLVELAHENLANMRTISHELIRMHHQSNPKMATQWEVRFIHSFIVRFIYHPFKATTQECSQTQHSQRGLEPRRCQNGPCYPDRAPKGIHSRPKGQRQRRHGPSGGSTGERDRRHAPLSGGSNDPEHQSRADVI